MYWLPPAETQQLPLPPNPQKMRASHLRQPDKRVRQSPLLRNPKPRPLCHWTTAANTRAPGSATKLACGGLASRTTSSPAKTCPRAASVSGAVSSILSGPISKSLFPIRQGATPFLSRRKSPGSLRLPKTSSISVASPIAALANPPNSPCVSKNGFLGGFPADHAAIRREALYNRKTQSQANRGDASGHL